MKVTEKPIELVIYETIEIPFSIFSKYNSGTIISWCNGFLIAYDEIDSQVQSQELVKHNKLHIKRLHYCKMAQFPKELKNQYGKDVQIMETKYSPIFLALAKYLDTKQSQENVKN